jgi:hypothetical protein
MGTSFLERILKYLTKAARFSKLAFDLAKKLQIWSA